MQPALDTHQKSGRDHCLAKNFWEKTFQLLKNQVDSYIYEEIIDNFVLFLKVLVNVKAY